jgi:nuclear transport factor 2 (NTF2) superfamily protein
MQGVTFPKGTDGWSRHQSNALLRSVVDMLRGADIQGLVDCFTEDCTIRYGASAEQQGRVPLRRILTELLSRRQNPRLQKTCIAIDRNKLVIRSEESWTDKDTGKTMAGFGVEVWTMRDGKIAVWEAAASAGENGEVRLSAAA